MLHIDQVSLRRGPRLLFSGADLSVHRGQKVGLAGANGSGKSSLFALIRGELAPDSGDCRLPPDWVIAHVAQETPAVESAALDYVLDGDGELRALQRQIAEAEAAGDGHRQAALLARLEAIDGYSAPSRAARLMHGLGFTSAQERAPVHTFSGGWRMRLNLARALMCRSDLLLLDEPTNHLDLDAVIWLEEWLRSYAGALLLISHDREFLDRTVHHIAHIEGERITLYAGNYSDFEVQRAARLANHQALYEKQQQSVAQMRRFVDRFRAKATKARQAQSRLKALARMELIAPAHADTPFRFTFRAPARVPNPLLQLEAAAAGYGAEPVVAGIDLSLRPGARLGLVGPNGAGKSTLIRLLAGAETRLLAGQREAAADLAIGYFAQHQIEQLRPGDSPLEHLRRLAPQNPEQELRDFLGSFGFIGDAALEPVAPLSGGEKARLVLALLVWQRPNLLLLDEPTNHLDLAMRHALELALQEFEGAMVVVSHDRHLLRSVTDELWLVTDGAVRPFEGDLEDYARWLAERRNGVRADTAPAPATHSAPARRERRREEAQRRQQLQPLRRALKALEQRMEQLEDEKRKLETALAAPELYDEEGKERLKTLLLNQARIDRELAETEEAWLAKGEELEAAEKA